MKIDDIQIEAVAKNHLWANITRDGDAFVLTDFRHPGSIRLEWDGDILWLTHSSGASRSRGSAGSTNSRRTLRNRLRANVGGSLNKEFTNNY